MSCCSDSIRQRPTTVLVDVVYFCPFAGTVPLDDVL